MNFHWPEHSHFFPAITMLLLNCNRKWFWFIDLKVLHNHNVCVIWDNFLPISWIQEFDYENVVLWPMSQWLILVTGALVVTMFYRPWPYTNNRGHSASALWYNVNDQAFWGLVVYLSISYEYLKCLCSSSYWPLCNDKFYFDTTSW